MKKSFALLIITCFLIIIVAGCTSTKDMGTFNPPTTITGTGPATMKFISSGGSHTFHVTSSGDHAGMIITITGTKRDSEGKIKSGDIVHDAFAPEGIDVSKSIGGFIADTYTIEVMTTNDNAPWSIEIK
jgi:hypothetical protein